MQQKSIKTDWKPPELKMLLTFNKYYRGVLKKKYRFFSFLFLLIRKCAGTVTNIHN